MANRIRNENVMVKLSPDEKADLMLVAEAYGETLAGMVRLMIRYFARQKPDIERVVLLKKSWGGQQTLLPLDEDGNPEEGVLVLENGNGAEA